MFNCEVFDYGDNVQFTFYEGLILEGSNNNEINKQDNNFNQQLDSFYEQHCETDYQDNIIRSLRRTKQSIYQYARNNEWQYFATFTFKDDSYRYDYEISCKKFRTWINDFKKRKCKIEYLCVPELHEDGAIHIHALINGLTDEFVEESTLGELYLKGYNLGISQLSAVKSKARVSSYITKYITKDMCINNPNTKRYFVSQGVKRPNKQKFLIAKTDERAYAYSKATKLANITRCKTEFDFVLSMFPNATITYTKTCDSAMGQIIYINIDK